MDGTYLFLRDLAVSQDLEERLMMAWADVAVEVYVDPNETQQHKTYAVMVTKSPRSVAKQSAVLAVILASDNTDEALKVAVETIFPVFASTVEVTA